MLPHPDDTIVALATAPGPGARAVVRIGGPNAWSVAASVFTPLPSSPPDRRQLLRGHLRLPGVHAALPADLHVWPAPRTYTGQLLVELHTLSCPPLLDLLIAALLGAGTRAARPGEFTMRAFLAGKVDLTRAEAVQGVVAARDRDELRHALAQLAGGLETPLRELREDLLNLLADVEAGLDFADEDIHFVESDELLKRLGRGLALVTHVARQVDRRSLDDRPYRVVLAGRPNAGKSSLFNALAGGKALVSPEPGTTRDYLARRLDCDGAAVELVDTAGWQAPEENIATQAQALGRDQAGRADLVLLCIPHGEEPTPEDMAWLGVSEPTVVPLTTRCDQGSGESPYLRTSTVTRQGLPELRRLLGEQARAHARPALAPSLSRCRHHVTACLDRLRRAHAVALEGDPPEILALELREALEQVGAMVGAVYTDDLLDRIFSRFCIGK